LQRSIQFKEPQIRLMSILCDLIVDVSSHILSCAYVIEYKAEKVCHEEMVKMPLVDMKVLEVRGKRNNVNARNNMGNEPILALPKGSDNFVVMRRERVRMLA
ncbi:hypothetical protein Tco_0076918, partial [Tanacetum coccineum]